MSFSRTHTRRRGAALGQHLLTNPNIASAVAEAAHVTRDTHVFEVGPGKGILTAELLKRGAQVTAVEKDPAMISILIERFEEEIKSKQLTLITGDARTITPDTVMKGEYVIAANIPYYITGELLRIFLTAPHQPTTIALLVQKEVAERIARSKKESILSLSIKVYGTPRYVVTVKRGNFNPAPKVDSAILSVEHISRDNFKKATEERFFQIVRAGFGQKRKTLAGNLKRVLNFEPELPPKIRAEDMPLSAWLALAATDMD